MRCLLERQMLLTFPSENCLDSPLRFEMVQECPGKSIFLSLLLLASSLPSAPHGTRENLAIGTGYFKALNRIRENTWK